MSGERDLLDIIPVGKENAVSARSLWEAQGRVWIIATIKVKLKRLMEAGLIERSWVSLKGGRVDTAVYFKKPNWDGP